MTGPGSGAYTAARSAALSGVPWSTVHDWARKGVLVPSVSPTKIKLWSYVDLMGLRTIYWLRKKKTDDEGADIPATTMPVIKHALAMLAELDLELWTEDAGPSVCVDPSGQVFINTQWGPEAAVSRNRPLDGDLFDLIAPLNTPNTRGPNLHRPSPHLRIVPGKLTGSPHIAHSRIETLAVAALSARGYDRQRIEHLYPAVPPVALVEAVDLEHQLTENLRRAA